ncbi:hypothetical protein HNO89_003854 [Sporosarcina luteola]|nr:hypothetical protein [Sporosarcina luteola]
MEFVKAFQEFNNAYEALDDYNDDMETFKALTEQVKRLEEYLGVYHIVKGSLLGEKGMEMTQSRITR